MTWKIAGEIGKVIGAPLVGGIFGSRQAGKAADASARANAEALAFEKQKYAEEQQFARQQWEAQEAQQAPYRAARYALAQGLARKYGIELPPMVTPTFPGIGGDVSGGGRVGGSTGPGMTLGRLAGRQTSPGVYEYGNPPPEPSTPALMAPPIMTLGDLGRRNPNAV